MEKILDAVEFASEAHKKQVKKSSDIPYISHPLSVGLLRTSPENAPFLKEEMKGA